MKRSLYFKVIGLISIILFSIFIFVNFYIINSFKERLIKQVPKSAVDTAYSIIKNYSDKEMSHELLKEDAQSKAKEEISHLKLDDGSYFWIHSEDLKMIMHPIKPEMNNTDLSRIKSDDGKNIFADMNDVIKNNKGMGWYHYNWPKPNEVMAKEKTSYLRYDNNWKWIIGSGMYVEDIEQEMKPFVTKIQIILAILFIFSITIGHILAKKISQKLSHVSSDVSDTASHVNQIINETKNNIHALAQISIEQASAIEETAASVHEINMMALQNVKNSDDAIKLTSTNKKISIKGKNALAELEESINQIDKSIKTMNGEIDKNNLKFEDIISAIKEINNKTKIINEIVFQTKLLSFNASVEAARAGEHGRGFSVVAEEIGKLAEMSGLASKEINSLISSSTDKISTILLQSKEIISALNLETKNKVEQGHQTSHEFSDIFDSIIQNVEQMNKTVEEMSLASKEQGDGITQINIALAQLTDAGHHGINSTEEIKFQIEKLDLDAKALESNVLELNVEVVGKM